MNTSSSPLTGAFAQHLIRHVVVEAKGCPFNTLNSCERMLALLEQTADVLRTEVMQSASHQFTPHGVTAVLIVGASHLSVHTWPEFAFATLDLVVCTENFSMDDVVSLCQRELQAQDISWMEFRRGLVRNQ